MGFLERWDRRNQRFMEYANDQAAADDWFKGLPSLKQLAAICVATEIAGFVLRGLLGPRWSITIMATAAVAFFAVAVRQHRRRRRRWDEAHPPADGEAQSGGA
jgi:Flp pilus assembly protein TadB